MKNLSLTMDEYGYTEGEIRLVAEAITLKGNGIVAPLLQTMATNQLRSVRAFDQPDDPKCVAMIAAKCDELAQLLAAWSMDLDEVEVPS